MTERAYRPQSVQKGREPLGSSWQVDQADTFVLLSQLHPSRGTTSPPQWVSDLWKKLFHERPANTNRLDKGERLRELYYSKYYADPDEDSWTLSRVLGSGSFGIGVLLEKRSADGIKLDEVVMKAEAWTAKMQLSQGLWMVNKEAFLMHQLNERKQQGNLFLRSFKCIQAHEKSDGTPHRLSGIDPQTLRPYETEAAYTEWRCFLEYCKFGTLQEIMLKYKAWGYHLPESFVWWLFWFLASACQGMDIDNQKPFFSQSTEGRRTEFDSFIIHNDIKDENIFITEQNPEEKAPFSGFPCLRLGDYGLSQLLSDSMSENQARFVPPGTKMYRPPEKRSIDYRAISSRSAGDGDRELTSWYPFERYRKGKPVDSNRKETHKTNSRDTHALTPAANVWGIGFMMYLVMTLRERSEISKFVKEALDNPEELHLGEYIFQEEDFASDMQGAEDYSSDLKRIVLECTRVYPERRPSSTQLLQAIEAGLKAEQDRLSSVFDGNEDKIKLATRVCMTPAQWNRVCPGPYDHGVDVIDSGNDDHTQGLVERFWSDWTYCFEQGFADPDEERLYPPTRYRCVSKTNTAIIDEDGCGHLPIHLKGKLWKDWILPSGGRAQPDDAVFGHRAPTNDQSPQPEASSSSRASSQHPSRQEQGQDASTAVPTGRAKKRKRDAEQDNRLGRLESLLQRTVNRPPPRPAQVSDHAETGEPNDDGPELKRQRGRSA